MEINRIRWKNFASWGNAWREIDFGREGSLTLLCGMNGSGKSSISNIIVYMLYGKLEGFTLSDIANRTNRHFEGEIYVTSGGKSVVVRRGLNPASFSVECDGREIDTAGKANVQKWLDEEIYGIPYNLFRNSVVLSVDTFKSFITLTPKDRREIIDRLFGYEAINLANAKVKEKVKEYKGKLDVIDGKVTGYENSIAQIERKMKAEAEKADEKHRSVDEIKGDIAENTEQEGKYGDAKSKINGVISNINTKMGNISNERYRIDADIRNFKRSLELYRQDRCPTCGAKLDGEEHLHRKELLEGKLAENTEKYNALGNEYDGVKEKLRIANEKLSKCERKLYELQVKSRNLNLELGAAGSARKSSENYSDMITELRRNISETEKERKVIEKKVELLNITLAVFGEGGVKKYIGNIYAPMINSYIREIGERLGVIYRIEFDGNYECRIFHLGKEVNYRTLSTGERKKANVAVTLAFLRMVKQRIGNINILILDEIFSSIDIVSVNGMLSLIREYSREWGADIWLVHHANLETSEVDRVIEVGKVNGFSNFLNS